MVEFITQAVKDARDRARQLPPAICIGGPLMGQRFPVEQIPDGYHRCGLSSGFHQGHIVILEADGTDCLETIQSMAERIGMEHAE